MPSNSLSEHPAVEACGVVKTYSGTRILAGVDLEVAKGTSFGLLGLNGAGKTTLIKCMLDFCSVDSGMFKIFGIPHTATSARARMGFVPERFVPPYYLTCREFIAMTSSLAGDGIDSGRIRPLFDELGLDPAVLESPVRQLSKGMTQKVGLAACLLADRDLYVLDEPMSGLDPASRIAVKTVLARLARDGRTLFFTSHVLADIEELCSSIAILDRGIIRFRGPPRELCERYSEASLERAFLRCIHGYEPAIAA